MERDHDIDTETIELGTASVETRGPVGPFIDERLTAPMPGLGDG
ncbi:benenodin family lasso peptide [Allosphingosinicella sp.]